MKINKLIRIKNRKERKNINKINKNKLNKPQMKGIIIKLFNMTPKKPNSALRKVAKVVVKNVGIILAYIPGEKHTLTLHNEVLIRKGKVQDLVGVNYKIIRGPLDAKPPIRNTSRSKYGTPKSIISKNK
jgi:small subunit ribosomal protein S12